jgi:hypothetical protein
MVVFEVDGGPRMVLPDEPLDLKVRLRDALLDGGDWRDDANGDLSVGLWLWAQWQSALEPKGVLREEFIDLVFANKREQWLWLVGDRQWIQYLTGLAGRVVRRLPVATDA